jgi:hypothetical protein
MESYATHDLKLIYRVLHAHLLEHAELMDSDFFTALQGHLQTLARKDGVELGDHSQWEAWLAKG